MWNFRISSRMANNQPPLSLVRESNENSISFLEFSFLFPHRQVGRLGGIKTRTLPRSFLLFHFPYSSRQKDEINNNSTVEPRTTTTTKIKGSVQKERNSQRMLFNSCFSWPSTTATSTTANFIHRSKLIESIATRSELNQARRSNAAAKNY